MKRFFNKQTGIRLLIILAVTVLVLGWTYVALSLLSGWNWPMKAVHNAAAERSGALLWALIGIFLGLGACLGALTYLNATQWMIPFLERSLFCFFGWLPFMSRFDPDYTRNARRLTRKIKKLTKTANALEKGSASRAMIETQLESLKAQRADALLEASDEREADRQQKRAIRQAEREEWKAYAKRHTIDKQLQHYLDVKDGYEYSDEYYYGPAPTSRLWSRVSGFIGRIFRGIGYFIAAIAIPVLSPAAILFGAWAVTALIGTSKAAQILTGTVTVALVVLIFIAYPIAALIKAKKARPSQAAAEQ